MNNEFRLTWGHVLGFALGYVAWEVFGIFAAIPFAIFLLVCYSENQRKRREDASPY